MFARAPQIVQSVNNYAVCTVFWFDDKFYKSKKRQRIPQGQSKMDTMIGCWLNVRENRRDNKKIYNPEKPATYGTQNEDKQNKNTMQYVLGTTIFKQIQIR